MDYPVKLERDDNDTVLVSFPDFPEAHTFGEDEADALRHAVDALATVIDAYIKNKREIPLPSAIVTKRRVTVPALVEAKVRLYESMRAAGVGKAELARRLHWHPPQVDRLLEMTHGSKLEQLEAAFGALGKRLIVGIEEAPIPAAVEHAAFQFWATPRRAASGGGGVSIRRRRAGGRHGGRQPSKRQRTKRS